MPETFVAITRDWRGDAGLAEQILSTLPDRYVSTLYHFGEYGARTPDAGRDPFTDEIESRCFELAIDMRIELHPSDLPAWEHAREGLLSPRLRSPIRGGSRQRLMEDTRVGRTSIRTLSRLAERDRLGIVNLKTRPITVDWIDLEL